MKAGIIKSSVPVGVRHNTSVKVTMEYATRNNAWLMRIRLRANFEDDYNVENTAIAALDVYS